MSKTESNKDWRFLTNVEICNSPCSHDDPILIGVSMVVFLLVASLPGDAVDAHAGGNITAEKIAQNKALLGLDKPIPERYVNWASHAIRGDFGISISYKIPVTEVIGKFVWNSFLVAAVAFILQLLIAIPIGVISATKQYSIFDNTFSVVAFAGISLPSFFPGNDPAAYLFCQAWSPSS